MSKSKPIVVHIGTYPPRECGIATFNQDLLKSSKVFLAPNMVCKVAAVNLSPLDHYLYPPEVAWEIDQNNQKDYENLAISLNENSRVSGVILHHEYGIYGGEEGENILAFAENCTQPLLVTLHTVLPDPSPKMKFVTGKLIQRANIIVVLTENSRKILATVYPFSIGKTYVIPHGIHATNFSSTHKAKRKLKLSSYTVLSTFGLLSRGKGIEYVLTALPEVIKKFPFVKYLILGGTHPAVRRQEGEKYRSELADLVTKLGLKDHVKFYYQYLDLEHLIQFLQATDIYISTSINPNQAVSGTLSYALGTGRAVISTSFTQAKEIITPKNGRLVPIKNATALSQAIQELLKDPDQLMAMHLNAYESTRSMLWSKVAEEYSDILSQLVLPPLKLNHLKKMTDNFGLFQFAQLNKPNTDFGYTLDDNARALIVCCQLLKQKHSTTNVKKLLATYLSFIECCQQEDGSFVNYIEYLSKKPTPQNSIEDLSDAQSRAILALVEVMRTEQLSQSMKDKARNIFVRSISQLNTFPHLRSKALIIKSAISAYGVLVEFQPQLKMLIEENSAALVTALMQHEQPSWYWFENELKYNNAVLSESLMAAGVFLKKKEYLDIGTRTLQFLIQETFLTQTNSYAPIGQSLWYQQNQERGYFDQQPEDPASMILALMNAYEITGQQSYKNLARQCFSWFLGNNSLHLSLYDYQTGGCYDGLHPDRVNLNQGAESLVSYLLSRLAITNIAYDHSTTS